MSVNRIFGQNLRQLCESKASIAAVARELDIGKVQFHRFLNSESFPKPNVLKKICDYFDVDGRIVIEKIGQNGLSADTASLKQSLKRNWETVFDYALGESNYFRPSESFPDGMYANWRESFSNPGSYIVTLLQLKTIEGARVFRGYDHRLLYGKPNNRKDHEYRGVLLNQKEGYCGLFFHKPPSLAVTSVYYEPLDLGRSLSTISGTNFLSRRSYEGKRRIGNSLLVELPPKIDPYLKIARWPLYLQKEDLPELVAANLPS